MFKNSFGYLVKEGLHNIRANRQMSVASIGVLIACMVLIGAAAFPQYQFLDGLCRKLQ